MSDNVERLADKINDIGRSTNEVRKAVTALRRPNADFDRQRRRIAEEEHKVQRLVSEIKSLPRPDVAGPHRTQMQKLERDYQRLGVEFKAVFKEAIELLKHQPGPGAARPVNLMDEEEGRRDGHAGGQHLAEPLLKTAAPEAVCLEVGLQEEKLDDLRHLERDLVSLNELFTDLQIQVHHQQSAIDTIEGAVEETASKVTAGTSELVQAQVHQKSARKKMCCILCCLAIAMAVVFGILGGVGKL